MSMTIIIRFSLSEKFINLLEYLWQSHGLNWSNFWCREKRIELKNARLADICIGTTAAPTYLPAHYFETKDAKGSTKSYDLIDGGVAANNPVRE